MSDKPENIWLIDVDGDEFFKNYVWCDCPTPSPGMEEADSIEYIRADLAKPSEWISVDDLLPGEFGNYMVCLKNNTVIEFSFSNITETPYWFKVGHGEAVKENPVTHWQPLPEPPK